MRYLLVATMIAALSQTAIAADTSTGSDPMRSEHGSEHKSTEHMGSEHKSGTEQTAEATGTIKSIQKESVTIAHDAVPSLSWGAKTRHFSATPDQLKDLKVGDKVKFEFSTHGKKARIQSIETE